jgi:hypothetical protein
MPSDEEKNPIYAVEQGCVPIDPQEDHRRRDFALQSL